MADPLQLALGTLVLWAPGLAWTWALVPELDLPRFAFVSVIAAFTVQPATLYVLNVFLGVPVTPANAALLALSLATAGLAVGLKPRLDRAWS
jgi:predicted membrane-bound spermidine synthase